MYGYPLYNCQSCNNTGFGSNWIWAIIIVVFIIFFFFSGNNCQYNN